MPGGRPTVYKPEYAQQLMQMCAEALADESKPFPTLARFAAQIGVVRQTLLDWATQVNDDGELKYPEFSNAYKLVKEYQEAVLTENGLKGTYQGSFAIFTAKNVLGWRDKQEHELSGKDGAPIQTEDVRNPIDIARRVAFLLAAGVKEAEK